MFFQCSCIFMYCEVTSAIGLSWRNYLGKVPGKRPTQRLYKILWEGFASVLSILADICDDFLFDAVLHPTPTLNRQKNTKQKFLTIDRDI